MTTFIQNMIALFSLTLLMSSYVISQEEMQMIGGTIAGTVLDSVSHKPMEYTNIILFSGDDSSMVTGITTGINGKFELTKLKPGKYYADVHFMGFEKKRVRDISVGQGMLRNDVGNILLKATEIALGSVVVEGERTSISYQIDKKVIDVSQMQTVVSGNASDVLQNVPSVTVDIEGNVSLRGSSDFTVLVDGRPSILDAQDVLQQIPATSIQTIEIITNPSAKYDPEGTAGIINIILKKAEDFGLNGISHMNAGLNDKYGGDFLLEYKNNSYTLNFGADYNRRYTPGNSRKEELYTVQGNTSTITSQGDTKWGREFWGLRGGLEFLLGEKDILSFGGRYGSREMNRIANLRFFEQSQNGTSNFINRSDMKRAGDFYSLNMNYSHKFERTGHEIKAEMSYSYRTGNETTLTESFRIDTLFDGIITTETGPSKEMEGKIDYTLPLGPTSKFETGYQGETEISNEITGLQEFDTQGKRYIIFPQFSHDAKYTETEHSLYSLYSDEWGGLGIQGGIRGEYTYRVVELADQTHTFKTDKWDFFPTIHASYKFQNDNQLMASYTRRIQRPGGWALEPFLTWVDANNVQQGNPTLKNQYIDSYEAGVQTSLSDIFFSTEVYYRITHNKTEQIRSAYSANVTLTSFENVGKDYSLGSEFQINFEPIKTWDVNFLGNVYKYNVEGIVGGEPFSRESFNWNTRLNNTLKFSKATQLQFNATYNSPSISSQGRREGFLTTDLALRQDLLERTLSLTLQIRDLFKTGKQEFTTQGTGYYSYNYSTNEAPIVVLSIKYLFNNYSQEESRQQPEEGNDGNDGF
jgi:outer membrane receptor protein involved in Fe transport